MDHTNLAREGWKLVPSYILRYLNYFQKEGGEGNNLKFEWIWNYGPENQSDPTQIISWKIFSAQVYELHFYPLFWVLLILIWEIMRGHFETNALGLKKKNLK